MTSLVINVQDINDNPPEFASKYYFAIVPEIDSVNSEVVRVLATSKDTGINADITYTIVGGNEHKKFKIDNKSGVISIAEMLDYERAKDYFLTIQATDGGDPPLSNRANVNITVTDSNDNAPVFGQVSYSARIREDAQIGDKIIQVRKKFFSRSSLFSTLNFFYYAFCYLSISCISLFPIYFNTLPTDSLLIDFMSPTLINR